MGVGHAGSRARAALVTGVPTIVLPVDKLRFPDLCVECEKPSARTFRLHAGAARVEAPVCVACSERKSLGQFLWVLAGVGGGVVVATVVSFALDAFVPSDIQRKTVVPFMIAILAMAVAPIWLVLRGGRRGYHRRYSAVWLEPSGSEIAVHTRTPQLSKAIAAQSGLGELAGYRVAPLSNDASIPKKNPIPSYALVVAGLALVGGGFARFYEFSRAERHGDEISGKWVEIIVYRIGGSGAVLALYASIGVLLFVGGIQAWRRAQRSAPSV